MILIVEQLVEVGYYCGVPHARMPHYYKAVITHQILAGHITKYTSPKSTMMVEHKLLDVKAQEPIHQGQRGTNPCSFFEHLGCKRSWSTRINDDERLESFRVNACGGRPGRAKVLAGMTAAIFGKGATTFVA